MAEKMPDKWIFDEASGWLGNVDGMAKMFYPRPTQDDIDALASLLPEPRRMLLSRGTTNDLEKCFVVDYLDMNWDYIITAPALTQLWINKNITGKLSALVEGFCAEVERQLK